MIAGMIIGATRDPFIPGLFYSMLAGAIIIIVYSSLKNRKEKKAEKRNKRKFKK